MEKTLNQLMISNGRICNVLKYINEAKEKLYENKQYLTIYYVEQIEKLLVE